MSRSEVQVGEPPLRRSQRVPRAPQRLIETFVASLLSQSHEKILRLALL